LRFHSPELSEPTRVTLFLRWAEDLGTKVQNVLERWLMACSTIDPAARAWSQPPEAGKDDEKHIRLRVVCYSGRKEDERPVRFELGDHDCFVEEVVDQWDGPDDTFFKVRTSNQNLYVLRRHLSTLEAEWTLESFRGFTGVS
jgi:hypothetical protein